MKIVILCGGKGTRISEETYLIPKPMVKIGNIPILIHIMNIYKKFGYKDFILALGYKGKIIKKYFQKKKYLKNVKLVNTGKNTMTGGRLLKLKKYFAPNEDFMLTYGDGLSNINIEKLLKFHKSHNKIATLTAIRPPVRFGELKINRNTVKSFKEKPQSSSGWINGGFFVLNYKIFNYINSSDTMLERQPLEKLSKKGELKAFCHKGFWQCMDTLRDKILLNKMFKSKKIPWIG